MDLLVVQIVDLITLRWISETMARVARTLRCMSETISRVLGKGAGDSPGALDAKIRHQVDFWPKSLTWRGSKQG